MTTAEVAVLVLGVIVAAFGVFGAIDSRGRSLDSWALAAAGVALVILAAG
jgi:hypothetical protein